MIRREPKYGGSGISTEFSFVVLSNETFQYSPTDLDLPLESFLTSNGFCKMCVVRAQIAPYGQEDIGERLNSVIVNYVVDVGNAMGS